MPARLALMCLVILAGVPFAAAKNKQELPNYVLQAQTVAVVIPPDAGEPVANPTTNRTAQENVEKALSQWGRFATSDGCRYRGPCHSGSERTCRRPDNR